MIKIMTAKELVKLVEQIKPEPQAKVRDGKIICDFCDRPAESIHLLGGTQLLEVKAACAEHDPGGYWFYIDEFLQEPLDWLTHMAQKIDLRVVVFLRWLGYEGAKALERMLKSKFSSMDAPKS